LLVLDAARRAGFNLSLLIDAASTKLALNKTREWSKAKSMDHMVQHERTRTALVESEAGKVKAIRTCNKCGYVGPLVLHPPCPYMSCIVPEAVGTLDEALSQEVVLQKRIEELKRGLKAAWNVANLAANGNIKMKSVIAEQKERIAELERRLTVAELEGRLEKAVTDALEAAVVRFEFVALEYCERWKVMPKQFIDKGTAAIRGKAVKG
jgi:hypothetical protein